MSVSSFSMSYDSLRPKAFLNWMVVGEDYVAAASSSNHVNAIQIPICAAGDPSKQIVGPANMVVRRNGWIYIYLSNESAQSVYFDNLVINLRHGPLLEQKEYYSFGMENPALSTQAIKQNYFSNRKKFEHQEYNDDLGLDVYEFKWRDHDPQIGRFIQVDPLANKYEYNSTYAFCENKVTSYIELEGLEAYADWRIEKDLSDVQSGKITSEQLDQRLQIRANSDLVAVSLGLIINRFGTGIINIIKNYGKEEFNKEIDQQVKQETKSVKSLQKRIQEHVDKLNEYKKDPEKNSDPELLKGKTEEQKQKILDGRALKLEKEIQKFQNVINQKLQKIKDLLKQKE